MGTPRVDISFQTVDNVTLRGWFYESSDKSMPAPTLVMCHGFTAVKEMDLDAFAEYFTSKLPIAVLVYDHRGFGASDHAPGHPRNEIIISEQHSDLRDAITYAQSRPDVDENKIGIWGSSYAGGHVLWVGATDRRVKVVMSQVPCVDGWESYHRLVPGDAQATLNELFQKDRLARAAGDPPHVIPIVDPDTKKLQALPSAGSLEFFLRWEKKCPWKNEVTLKSLETFREYLPAAHIRHISPTPLLLAIAENDTLAPTSLAMEAYDRALEPKQLSILPGEHFDAYTGKYFEQNASIQTAFIKKYLLKE